MVAGVVKSRWCLRSIASGDEAATRRWLGMRELKKRVCRLAKALQQVNDDQD